MRLVLTILLTLAMTWTSKASPLQPATPFALCRAAITAAERAARVPDRLMAAIGMVESGRRDAAGQTGPWPWTINAEGVGQYFETKAEAVAAVQALQARGIRSIDVGCMQVNLAHHPSAFASLDDAFDPVLNANYAARFLNQLLAQTGTWPRTVAGYHSLTPELGEGYAAKVLAAWPNGRARTMRPGEAESLLFGDGPIRPGVVPASGATIAMAGGSTALIIALPGPGFSPGGGADRASPGRLAVQLLPPGRP